MKENGSKRAVRTIGKEAIKKATKEVAEQQRKYMLHQSLVMKVSGIQ